MIYMPTYRKRPVCVEALQYDGYNQKEVIEFLGDTYIHNGNPLDVNIFTLEGIMNVSVGDYVIKGVQGEMYPCKPDIFEATYDIAD